MQPNIQFPTIMFTSKAKVWPALTLCVAAYATPLAANAQQAPGGTAPPPPKLEPLEEGEPPAITIRKPEERAKIEEKRAPGGRVTEVKVTAGKSTYYLKPNEPVGFIQPGELGSYVTRAAQWQVGEFDLGAKQARQAEGEQAAEAPAPPAPPPEKKNRNKK